jgi:hypothetical protein
MVVQAYATVTSLSPQTPRGYQMGACHTVDPTLMRNDDSVLNAEEVAGSPPAYPPNLSLWSCPYSFVGHIDEATSPV